MFKTLNYILNFPPDKSFLNETIGSDGTIYCLVLSVQAYECISAQWFERKSVRRYVFEYSTIAYGRPGFLIWETWQLRNRSFDHLIHNASRLRPCFRLLCVHIISLIIPPRDELCEVSHCFKLIPSLADWNQELGFDPWIGLKIGNLRII